MKFYPAKKFETSKVGEFILPKDISSYSCGVLRGGFEDVVKYSPYVREVIESTNLDLRDYEIDVKLHMLMKGQYSCIGGWHCDFIPRINGFLNFSDKTLCDDKKLFLWVSGEPTPVFLDGEFSPKTPHGDSPIVYNHTDIHSYIDYCKPKTLKVESDTWYNFSRLSPHIGTVCEENCWRIFVRLAHKDIVPENNIVNHNRRHSQVYLPTGFSW